jgi:hypothetical protein
VNNLTIDPNSRVRLEQIATRFCKLGPRPLADYLVQIATPVTVFTLLDVADDYLDWEPDPQTMRIVGVDRFPRRLRLVPSE